VLDGLGLEATVPSSTSGGAARHLGRHDPDATQPTLGPVEVAGADSFRPGPCTWPARLPCRPEPAPPAIKPALPEASQRRLVRPAAGSLLVGRRPGDAGEIV
jgi:hypothetical protein